MSGFINYLTEREALRSVDKDLKIDETDTGKSGWDLTRYYRKVLPNGKPATEEYTQKLPYRSNS